MLIVCNRLVQLSTGTSMYVKLNGHTAVMTITMVNTLYILVSKAVKLSLSSHELPAYCDVIALIRLCVGVIRCHMPPIRLLIGVRKII